MTIWRFADRLEPIAPAARLTLGEGNTPLVRSTRLGPSLGLSNLFFKLEISNPTASYKDRFAAAAISHMVAAGQTRCVATSSGNTGSSLAAYCALAQIECLIAIVEGAPLGKLQQMLAYGAKLFRIRGFGLDPQLTKDAFTTVKELGAQPGSATQVSSYTVSPLGMSGVKSLSYELAEQAEKIDHVFCPAGGGGMALAVARGFADLVQLGKIARSPRVEVVQPAGNDTIATPLRRGDATAREVSCTSRVSGLQVPNVMDGDLVVTECRACGGTGHAVSDEAVWETQARLAREEGIFCEPAGATSVTGLIQAAREGLLDPAATIVCCVTGSGFKDPPSVERMLAGTSCPLISLDEFREVSRAR
ncbi:Threonine synthase [Anatilimnocola aggregata]|uniref:Threonine synthase n=1 Tax=Anatilimnocola aggregata TaxID=2528021 RepID=A0A517Y7X4_9BACT|nr:pyridoxal-phosphate dependent enzyme [Anatilimnocola aggregata]QDU26338.1 Threonine synthase [Anatilimnocola aggregata]